MPVGVAQPFRTLGTPRPTVVGIRPPVGTGSPGGGGGGFGPPEPIPACPAGTAWDPYAQACVAVGQGPTLTGHFPTQGSSGPAVSGTESNTLSIDNSIATQLTVNANQAVSLVDSSASSAINSVTGAITTALNSANDSTNKQIQSAASDIGSAIDYYVGPVTQGINEAFTSLSGAVNDIETTINTALGGFQTGLSTYLNTIVSPIGTGLSTIITTISQQIGGLAGAIGTAVGQVIPAIVAAVSNPIGALSGVLGTIEGDIGRSVATLAQVGSDISGGFSSLDSTLQRILTSWEAYNSPFVEAQTGYPAGGDLHSDLSDLAKAIAGLVTSLSGRPTVSLSDYLTPLCNSSTLQDALNKQPNFEDLESGFWKPLGYVIARVWSWISQGKAAAEKIADVNRQKIDGDCPNRPLSIDDIVESEVRGFLPHDQAITEASLNNMDAQRYQAVRNLAEHQLSPGELVTGLYRGYVTQADYTTALNAQGWTPGQQNILQGLGFTLLSVSELSDLYRRQSIDQSTFDTALKALQYDSAQRKALLQLATRPAHMQEAIDGGLASDALGQMGLLAEVGTDRIPEYVATAAFAEGLSVDAMNARWLSHWSTGTVGNWITLYFRGLVSLGSLQAVMSRNYIPTSLQTTLIEAARPLVQYRTISNMLRIGQLDTQTAGQYLLKHGYTPQDVQLLITYAQRPGAATNPKKAQATHAVSLGIAHQEYIDGSISENDYYQILIAHGYTIDGANTEIAVVNAQQAMLTRKQNAQLVVDEYGAGLINEQTALAQLASQGLTVYELAKYTHRIKVFRVKGAKLPSEADLNHFLQLSIIDASTYKNQLQAQGYSSQAADWFYQYRVHPAASTPTSNAPATPAG